MLPLLIALAVVGCGEESPTDGGAETPWLVGRWEGPMQFDATEISNPGNGGTLVVQVEEQADGRLAGTARIRQGIVSGPELAMEGFAELGIVQMTITSSADAVLRVVGQAGPSGGVIQSTFLFDNPLSPFATSGRVSLVRRESSQ